MTSSSPKKSSKPYVYGGIGAVLAIIAMLVILPMLSSNSYSNNSGGGSHVPVYVPTPHTVTIVNSMIRVEAGQSIYYQFSAPTGSTDTYVSGTFTAGGGSGNDIRVYVMDEQNFINWRNGHQVSVYYNSGQETVGNINVNIPTGQNLYLVYDNTFSVFSAKEVTTNVSLTYTS